MNVEAGASTQGNCRDEQIAPWFLLRMTGFPQELITSLKFAHTRDAIAELIANTPDRAVRPSQLMRAAQTVFEDELADKVHQLQALAATPAFREAVFLSNPANYPLTQRWIDGKTLSPSKFRQGLLTSIMYLQRFCMKNDSASFFGPCFWGHLDRPREHNVVVAFGEPPKNRRTTFFAYWATDAIARWASKFPNAPHTIRPRRVPTMQLLAGSIYGVRPSKGRWGVVDERVDLPSYAAEVLDLVDGDRLLEMVFQEAQNRWDLSRSAVENIIGALVAAGLIHAHIEIPVGLNEPMEYLAQVLAQACVTEALPVVTELLKLKQLFASEGLAERQRILTSIEHIFEQTTHMPATRGAGQHYADRSIIYEDAARSIATCTLGGQLLHDLEDLHTIRDLLWIIHERDRELTQQLMSDWFQQRFPGRTRISFIEYAQAFTISSEEIFSCLDTAASELQETLRYLFQSLVPADAAHNVSVQCTITDIQRLIDRVVQPSSQGVVINPDILIASPSVYALNQGHYRIVLGEIHASVDLLTHTPLTFFLPEPEREMLRRFVSDRYRAAAAPDTLVADAIRLHLRKTSIQLALEGPDVEGQGRSQKPRHQVISLADLEVHLHEGALRLYAPRWQRFILLTSMSVPNGQNERTSLLRPFSMPEREGVLPLPAEVTYCPRIEVGKIVLRRRTWNVQFADWRCDEFETNSGWCFDLFLHVARLQQQLDLPDHLFAKIVGEPKPLFLDLTNYLLVHAFYKQWQKHRGSATLTEASPDICESWLQDQDGHYSCEFRMGFYRNSR